MCLSAALCFEYDARVVASRAQSIRELSLALLLLTDLRPASGAAPKRPMRRLLKKEVSLDTYTWQKKYGHLTSKAMFAAIDERLKRRFSVSASMEEIPQVRCFSNAKYIYIYMHVCVRPLCSLSAAGCVSLCALCSLSALALTQSVRCRAMTNNGISYRRAFFAAEQCCGCRRISGPACGKSGIQFVCHLKSTKLHVLVADS